MALFRELLAGKTGDARIGLLILVLLCGGDKRTQDRDIHNVPRTNSGTTKRAPRKNRLLAAPSAPYRDWLIKSLKDPKEAAAYLEAAIEEGDEVGIMRALGNVAEALGAISLDWTVARP